MNNDYKNNNKDLKYKRVPFFISIGIITFANLITLIYFSDDSLFKFAVVAQVLLMGTAYTYYYVQAKTKGLLKAESHIIELLGRDLKNLTYYISISLAFSVSIIVVPFKLNTTFQNHISNYLMIGILLGYLLSRISLKKLLGIEYGIKDVNRRYMYLTLITFIVGLFSVVNYFSSLHNDNFYLLGLMSSFVILAIIVTKVLDIIYGEKYYIVLNIIQINALVIYIVYIWLNIFGVISQTNTLASTTYALSKVIVLLYLISYIIYIVFKYKKNVVLEIILDYFIIYVTLHIIWEVAYNMGIVVSLPSQIAVIPYEMKYAFNYLVFMVWMIELFKNTYLKINAKSDK